MESNETNDQKPPLKEVTIVVNTRKHQVPPPKITFNEVVTLAFGSVSTNPNIVYTVTYKNGPKPNPEGTMDKDSSVHIQEGMQFSATQTDRS